MISDFKNGNRRLGAIRAAIVRWNENGTQESQGCLAMPQEYDSIKTFLLQDGHLKGAAVLAVSITDHMQTVTECERCAESMNRAISELRHLLYELSDLLQRYDQAWQLGAAARQKGPPFTPPAWFFQQESADLHGMLTRRVRYLRGAKVDVDQAWDLLTEFHESIHRPVDQCLLSDIVTATYGTGN